MRFCIPPKGALPLDPRPEAKYRKSQFKNAGDVAAFVVKNMPPGAAGSLKESEYWSTDAEKADVVEFLKSI